MSDIHANFTALEAVLKDAGQVDGVWFLGDLIGYGPDPNECVERIQQLPNLIYLRGNHDAAALEELDVDDFNSDARYALQWTVSALSKSSRTFLSHSTEQVVMEQYTLIHASPRYHLWEYILDTYTAHANFRYYDTDFCLIGHTHLPSIFYQQGQHHVRMDIPIANTPLQLQGRVIVNPGSVGQPRDANPQAAYALLWPEKRVWEQRRVEYDIAKVQARMRLAGLPLRHIDRLADGY